MEVGKKYRHVNDHSRPHTIATCMYVSNQLAVLKGEGGSEFTTGCISQYIEVKEPRVAEIGYVAVLEADKNLFISLYTYPTKEACRADYPTAIDIIPIEYTEKLK